MQDLECFFGWCTGIVRVTQRAGGNGISGPAPPIVAGLVPTAWYPNAVSPSNAGSMMYVANGKSDPGANPEAETRSTNQHVP